MPIAQALRALAQQYQPELKQGAVSFKLAGVRLFQVTQYCPPTPLVYEAGLIIIGQGHKIGHVGERVLRYDANNYLILGVSIPFMCETFATEQDPLLGLSIDIDLGLLGEMVERLRQTGLLTSAEEQLPCAIDAVPLVGEMEEAVVRLAKVLANPLEAELLGPAILQEILYRVLTGPQGGILSGLASYNGKYAQIAKALLRIQRDYAAPLAMEELAQEAGMSESAFYRAFRQVTLESPLQYLKKLRLDRARQGIESQGWRASVAAQQVGYESLSQFSREFKRHFGYAPSKGRLKHA